MASIETKQTAESVALVPNELVVVDAPYNGKAKFEATEKQMKRAMDAIEDADMHTHYWVRLSGAKKWDIYANNLCATFLSHLLDAVMSPAEEIVPLTQDLVMVFGVVVDFARAVSIKPLIQSKQWTKKTVKVPEEKMLDFGKVGDRKFDYLQFELEVKNSTFKQVTVLRFIPPELLPAFAEQERDKKSNRFALPNIRMHVAIGLDDQQLEIYNKFRESFYVGKIKKPYVYTLEYT